MSQRLPVPGSDDGTWGDILNAYLEVSHNADGTLANNVVGTSQIQNNAVTNTQLDTPTQTAIASVSSKYTKPGSGIPKTDLAISVQTSLSSADSSVQSVNNKTPISGNVTLAASDVGAVATTTTVNGHALSSNVTLSAGDVSAISTSLIGSASGVATLDSGSHLTSSQLPSSVPNGSLAAANQIPIANGSGGFAYGVTLDSAAFSVQSATYGALGNGKYVSDAAITSGSNQLSSTSASFTSADIGKAILVNGAGTQSGGMNGPPPIFGWISSVSGGVASLVTTKSGSTALNAATSVSAGNAVYGSDDTAAIQAAINAAYNASGGIVFFPRGTYIIAGALQTSTSTGGASDIYNAQICLPDVSASTSPKVPLRLVGPTPAGMFNGVTGVSTDLTIFTAGAILQSMLVGQAYSSGSGYPAMLAGPDEQMNSATLFTNLGVLVEGLTLRTPSNPSVTACNLSRVATARISDCTADTSDPIGAVYRPTNPAGRGIVLPALNNNTVVRARDIAVIGYFSGLTMGEHNAVDTAEVIFCAIGLDFNQGGGHQASIRNLGIENCQYTIAHVTSPQIVVSGTAYTAADYASIIGAWSTNQYLASMEISIEDHTSESGALAWAVPTIYNINDPSSQIVCPDFKYFRTKSGAATGIAINVGDSMRYSGLNIDYGGWTLGNSVLVNRVSGDGGVAVSANPKSRTTQNQAALYSGTGVPSSSLGQNGSIYFRQNGTTGTSTLVYVKLSGSWTGIL